MKTLFRILGVLPFRPKSKEDDMPSIGCDWCGVSSNLGENNPTPHVWRVVLICANCHKRTVFELRNNIVVFRPGKQEFGGLGGSTPLPVREVYEEAILCYYSLANRGAAVMCRSSVERALEARGLTGGDLDDKIKTALANTWISDVEHSIAHGSRLIGNRAIHREKTVTPSDVPAVLSATATVLRKLYP